MAQLAQRHSPAGVEELMPEHLASLTPSHQAMLAASRLLPQADSFSSSQGLEEGDTLAQMHASPFAAQDTSAGSAPLEHVALQQAVDGLAAAVAAGYTTPADMSRKRKAEGSFGRGAPGQKRFCPLCKNADGSPTPLAGNHNATCPWCKKCWSKKQRVLKADCTIHNHSLDGSMSTHPSMLHRGSEAQEHEQYHHHHHHHHHDAQQHDPHNLHHPQLPIPHMGLHHMQQGHHASHLDHLHEHGDLHAEQHTFHDPSHMLHHSGHYHGGLHDPEAGYHELGSSLTGHHHVLHDPSLVHEAALHAAHQLHGLTD